MSNIGNPDLIEQQFELSARCEEAVREMARQGDLLAQAEYDYHRQKAVTAFKLKDEGIPATMIAQVLKGQREVAVLMRERDVAKARYDATKETIMLLKLQMRMNDSQISREWGSNDGGY